VFKEHPLYEVGLDPSKRELWKKWSTLSVHVYQAATTYRQSQTGSGRVLADHPVWQPDATLRQMANALGATFTPTQGSDLLLRDPCAQAALRLVSFLPLCTSQATPVHSNLTNFLGMDDASKAAICISCQSRMCIAHTAWTSWHCISQRARPVVHLIKPVQQ
jgi:hypothetical protein